MTRLSEEQISELKGRVDLAGLAQDLGARLRHSGGRFVGSCPICGGGKRATRFEVKGEGWVCAVCPGGGDAIALVRKVLGLDFAAAIERLGGPRVLSAEETSRLATQRRDRDAKEQAEAESYRRREIETCLRIWETGRAPGALLATYWQGRGLELANMPKSVSRSLSASCGSGAAGGGAAVGRGNATVRVRASRSIDQGVTGG